METRDLKLQVSYLHMNTVHSDLSLHRIYTNKQNILGDQGTIKTHPMNEFIIHNGDICSWKLQ